MGSYGYAAPKYIMTVQLYRTMKPELKRLKDLSEKTKKFRTKIKVLHKGSPQELKDRARYQRLLLQDDQPQYKSLMSIPRDPHLDTLYDIIGVIIFVTEPRTVVCAKGGEDKVEQVDVIDSSKGQHRSIRSVEDHFTSRGFYCPEGKREETIEDLLYLSQCLLLSFLILTTQKDKQHLPGWRCDNEELLEKHRARMMRIHDPTKEPPLISIADLKAMKAHDKWQEERFYLYVSLPNVSEENLRIYLGCSICGKRSGTSESAGFSCNNCGNSKAECVPSFSFWDFVTFSIYNHR